MSQDGSSAGSYSDTASGTIGGILTSYAGSALARYGLGPSGKGQMAQRGQAAAAAKFGRQVANQNILYNREVQAMSDFEQRAGGAPGDIFEFNPDPKAQKILKTVQTIQGAIAASHDAKQTKKLTKKLNAKEAKLERRLIKEQSKTQIRVGAEYGANAGYWREHGAPPPAWLTARGTF